VKMMKIMTISMVALFAKLVFGATNCSNLMATRVSERFPGVVAHGIHSLDVVSLREFKADVTSENGIPTINRDLRAADPILSNAPLLLSPFSTTGMKIVDEVLSHMDDDAYDVRGYTALERLEHALHMQEVWAAAKPHYMELTSNHPDPDLCGCVVDVEANGIMKMLRFIALKVREPQLMYGKYTTVNGKPMKWDGNLYSYTFASVDKAESLDSGEPFPRLDSSTAWQKWKDIMMSQMNDADNHELALYLYCALNGTDKN